MAVNGLLVEATSTTYELTTATPTVLGGVKIGTGIDIASAVIAVTGRKNLSRATTDATPAEMTVDATGSNLTGTYPSSTTHFALDPNETYGFTLTGVATQAGSSSNCAYFSLSGIAANVGGTITLSAITINLLIQNGLAVSAPVPTADNTNHAVAFAVTGIAATTIRWYATLDFIEVAR